MDITLIILLVMVVTALAIAFLKGGWRLVASGVKQGGQIFQLMWLRVLMGFALGGLIQVLIPNTLIADWLGPASGLKGILIASYAGIFMPGGPHVRMPVIAAILAAGAGVGPIISLISAMNLISIQMLAAWQIPFLGLKIPLTRYFVCLFIPPLIGLGGAAIYRLLNLHLI